MARDYVSATKVVNGYFYSFFYEPSDQSTNVDYFPLIYCIGPAEGKENVIVGLNFHHIPRNFRLVLLTNLQKYYNFIEKGRFFVSVKVLNKMLPGCKAAIRYYNLKRIRQPLKIANKALPMYIDCEGALRGHKPNREVLKYFGVNS